MKKALVLILVLLLNISLITCSTTEAKVDEKPEKQIQETRNNHQSNHEDEVQSLVEEFGKRLQLVSLLAPEDVLEESMQENYGEFVAPSLLKEWLKDPVNAPGRLTSSPWPDRIEILGTEKISEGAYEVKGEIIEVANGSDEIVERRQITLMVEKIEGKWLINDAHIGENSV